MDNKILSSFSSVARDIIIESVRVAHEYKDSEVKLLHFFLSLLSIDSSIKDYLSIVGLDLEATKREILSRLPIKPLDSISSNEIAFSKELKDLLILSYKRAIELESNLVSVQDLFYAFLMMKDDFLVKDLIDNRNINFDNYMSFVQSNRQATGGDIYQKNQNLLNINSSSILQPMNLLQHRLDDEFTPDGYLQDLNQLRKENSSKDKIIGREKEILRLMTILSRKYKNNPILLGDPGVGKTAVVYGFVDMLNDNSDVPYNLKDIRVYSLSVTSLIAGSKLRGEIEDRIESIMEQIMNDGNAVLFIDEIHMIVGAGAVGSKDSMDLSNILKPYLVDGGIRIIGATTKVEYEKNIEIDKALARRFQPIYVEELSIESTKLVMRSIKKSLESYHSVIITDDIIDIAIILSDRYIKDRYFPDKVIDVLDEAAAHLSLGVQYDNTPEINSLAKSLLKIQEKKKDLLLSNKFKEASKLKVKENEIKKKLELLKTGRYKVKGKTFYKHNKKISYKHIVEVVRSISKVPNAGSDLVNDHNVDVLDSLKKIIGQDEVIKNVSNILQRSFLGFRDINKPIASFLFLGPTGVGKTQLAKYIASEFFAKEKGMLQLNMSEFMESHSVAKLIGAPPGYIGYDEGGILSNYVRQNPYTLVLFDEIEKAHPDVLNILLQILDEGFIQDGKGNKVFFNNTIIVLTSNIGMEAVSGSIRSIGFVAKKQDKEEDMSDINNKVKEIVMNELRRELKPELLNRIDDIEVFNYLSYNDARKIVDGIIEEYLLDLLHKGVIVSVDENVKDYILDVGYSKEYGVRNLRRSVTLHILNKISDYIVLNSLRFSSSKPISLVVNFDSSNRLIKISRL